MLNINVKQSVKCNSDYSLFLSFPYDANALTRIKELPYRYWHTDIKQWEVPLNKLQYVLDVFKASTVNIYDEDSILFIQTEKSVKSPLNYEFKTKPFKHQIEGFNYGMEHSKWLLADTMGLGKALSLNTKVYTPYGYKEMKDIQVGDYVFNRLGEPTKVLAVYNHKNVEMYKITFSDGRSVECCKDHLWKINTTKGTKVVDTKWFMQKDQFGNNRYENLTPGKYWIDRCEPVQFKHTDVNLDAYILGALLGDGCIVNGVGFTSEDEQIINEINNRLPKNYCLNSSASMSNVAYNIIQKNKAYNVGCTYYANGIRIGTLGETAKWLIENNKVRTSKVENIYAYLHPKALDKVNTRYGYTWSYEKPLTHKGNIVKQWLIDLGLYGTNSHTKFIPDCYKYNDVKTRLDVIRGLIDTDGYATKDNLLQYTTVSKQLMEDVRWIIESLGGMCSVTTSTCGYNGKITGIAYTLTIKIDNPQELCLLERKKCLLHERKFKPKRSIIKVERIKNADAKCITVEDNESLYLIDYFIVTHNTKQIVDIAVAKKYQLGYNHCLIICGVNGLKWNWLEEISTHTNESGHILGQKIKNGKITIGSTKDKVADLENIDNIDSYFIITNIESLRDENIVKHLTKLCKNNTIEMIACDEIQSAKSPTSQQSRGLLKLKCKNMIAMTGTPLMNSPLDLFVVLKWLGYEEHPFYSFKQHYCEMGGYGGYQIVGYKNLSELQNKLSDIMLRRVKEDVLDLPEKTYIDEYVEMGKAQEKIYREVTSDIKQNIDKIKMANNPLAQLIRLRQATGYTGILSSDVKESAKLDRMEELIEESISNGRKVVVFSNWTSVTDAVEERLKKKYKYLVITGDTKDNDRQNIINKFQNDDSYKIIIGTSSAMGTGITLTAATVEIFLDHPWNRALYDQCVDRCHRIGQKDNLIIYNLLTKDTIDDKIWNIVNKKGKMSDMLVDGKTDIDKDALVDYLLS